MIQEAAATIAVPIEVLVIGTGVLLALLGVIYRGLVKRQDKMEVHIADLTRTVQEFTGLAAKAMDEASKAITKLSEVVSADVFSMQQGRTDEHIQAVHEALNYRIVNLIERQRTDTASIKEELNMLKAELDDVRICVAQLRIGGDCD